MLIIVRWILKAFKRDRGLVARYERSHPHFIAYIFLDAFLSVALIFAGFSIFSSRTTIAPELAHAAGVVMSFAQLDGHLKKDGVQTYWIGPISGDHYELNQEVQGIVDIWYLPKGVTTPGSSLAEYEVKTYANQGVWDAHTHPILASVDTQVIAISPSVSMKINPSSMKGEIVTFSDRPEIVAIAFSKPQTLETMEKEANSLTLVG